MVITREIADEIKNAVNLALNKCLTDQTFIKTLADSVSKAVTDTVKNKLQQLEQKVTELKNEMNQTKHDNNTQIKTLGGSLKKITGENEMLRNKLDNMEQEMKKNNLRIFNLQENSQENTSQDIITFFRSKLAISLEDKDIDICYRIGKNDNTRKPRGIFLKLKNFDKRQEIYHKKKLLKGTGVIIREDLTKLRVEMLSKAIEKTSLKNVWTEGGKIFVNIDNKVIIINNNDDFRKVFPL
ncbi:unnamed protein product [Phaedon cochleariae]|uniref:Uncharacterized protein n=1 Tax=Phaedon cochleariae TaxID=80249 RepID=A0A9N9SJP4_PHACE|nr:unnamed protein product [Phaedon cochleariae]